MVFSDLTATVFSMTIILQVYVSSGQEISPIYISVKECNYLKSTEGQDNAYINAKGKICCLCSKGTEWKGDCNSFQHNSTVCKACHWNEDNINDRYYVDFEPHMQKQCFPVEMKNCHPNKIYKDGSATERPRCVCPPGTIKDGKRRCERVSHTPASEPPAQETTSQSNEVTSTLTKSIGDQAVTKQNRLSRMTKMTKKQSKTTSTELKRGANVTHQTVTHEETITTTKKPETTSTHPEKRKPVETVHYSIYMISGVILLIAVIILAILVHKYKPCNDATKDSSPCSSCDVSHEALTRGSNRCPDVSILVQYENAAAENNATPTMAREAVDEKRVETIPLISDEGVEPEEQPQTLRNELPLQGPPLSAQPTDPVPEEKDFATEVAKELGVVMKKEDAKQIFRHYVSSPRCENELEEIMQKGENSVNTYITYMSWLKNKKGKELTPEYLLEKSKTMEPFYKIIVETIEDKMKEFGIEVPEDGNKDDSISECINIL